MDLTIILILIAMIIVMKYLSGIDQEEYEGEKLKKVKNKTKSEL